MVAAIPRIDFPEIFIGFVAPIGTDIRSSVDLFAKYFRNEGYDIHEIKVTDIFKLISAYLAPRKSLVSRPLRDRYLTHIAYGNQVREAFDDDAALAALTIPRIMRHRMRASKDRAKAERNVYLVHQFKRREEVELFRSVYGRVFFQVSVYSRRGARVDFLAKKFAEDENSRQATAFRGDAEQIVQKDENEIGEVHGQQVSSAFHDGDAIFNLDVSEPSIEAQVNRFCDLLFGSNSLSPTKIEYGMFAAKAAALRTLDLSRQVGAAIFSNGGEIVSMGSNEVPKALGGTYWCDEKYDDRDYKRKFDSNDRRKRELLGEILDLLGHQSELDTVMARKDIIDSQFMDALEYGRVIHAEMSAICDAARLGRSTQDSILFSTTFPCHLCAKHIVGAGIRKVVFLEPYPKSLAADLHGDAISIEGSDRGKYQDYPAVEFTHFFGISPRRYREFFERAKRKNERRDFVQWRDGVKRPLPDLKFPFYFKLEEAVLEGTVQGYLDKIRMSREALDH